LAVLHLDSDHRHIDLCPVLGEPLQGAGNDDVLVAGQHSGAVDPGDHQGIEAGNFAD
jgi:hypothetical protein